MSQRAFLLKLATSNKGIQIMPINPLDVDNAEQAVGTLKAMEQEQRINATNKLLEEVQGTVVMVSAGGKGCDGFFINDGTEVVTSNDLFRTPESRKDIEVLTESGKVLKAHIETQTDDHEEVILKLDGVKPNTYKSLKLGSADDIERRESVLLYGHRDAQSNAAIALGRVQSHYDLKAQGYDSEAESKMHRFIDCVMPPGVGLSGSPLLNMNGEVIGMYQNIRPTQPGKSNNVLVRCDDVSELKEVLSGDEGRAEAASEKPTTEQAEAIAKRIGKLTRQTVIEFEADWCGYCQLQKKLTDSAEKKYGDDLQVVHINIDKKENAELAAAYGIGSERKGVPVTVFIGLGPDGEILSQEVTEGYSKDAFQQRIDQLMADKVKDKKSP